MNEPDELQGMSFYEFDNLMGRLALISPDWAQYIKFVQNKKTNQIKDENGYLTEQFTTKNKEKHDIANYQCCIVGEAHYNSSRYNDSEECDVCTEHSDLIYIGDDEETSIINLDKLNDFIWHVKDEHQDLYRKEEVKE